LKPEYPNLHNNLGLALLATGDVGGAVGELEQGVRLRPDAVAHFNLGLALARGGQADEAIAHYREALRSKPDFAEAARELAVALAAREKPEEAKR